VKIVIWVSVIVLAIVILAVGGLAMMGAKPTAESATVSVQIYDVQKGELAEIVGAPGEVEPRRDVQISARVSARIIEIPHDEGEAVFGPESTDEPSVLLRLDASDIEAGINSALAHREAQARQVDVSRARLESARANIRGIEVSLAESKRDLERQTKLYGSRDVSKATVDQAQKTVDELQARLDSSKYSLAADELNIEVLELNLKAKDADIARTREDLKYTIILAPIDGIVTRINAEVGEMVVQGTMNNRGTVILEVADLSTMIFVAQIDEADIGHIHVDQKAEVFLQAYPDDIFEGVIEEVALKHDISGNGSKYFKTRIALDTAGKQIYTGLTGDAQIVTQNHDDIIRVPSQAVVGRRTEDLPEDLIEKCDYIDKEKTFTPVVYRFQDDKAVATPIEIGPSDDTHTVILAGLEPGDRIIDGPYNALEDLKHDQSVKDKDAKSDPKDDDAATPADPATPTDTENTPETKTVDQPESDTQKTAADS
jgi:HlyD family secretion protein